MLTSSTAASGCDCATRSSALGTRCAVHKTSQPRSTSMSSRRIATRVSSSTTITRSPCNRGSVSEESCTSVRHGGGGSERDRHPIAQSRRFEHKLALAVELAGAALDQARAEAAPLRLHHRRSIALLPGEFHATGGLAGLGAAALDAPVHLQPAV